MFWLRNKNISLWGMHSKLKAWINLSSIFSLMSEPNIQEREKLQNFKKAVSVLMKFFSGYIGTR